MCPDLLGWMQGTRNKGCVLRKHHLPWGGRSCTAHGEETMQSSPRGLVTENVAQAVSLKSNTPAMGRAWEIREGFLEEEVKEDK